jgi:hypothetical protein
MAKLTYTATTVAQAKANAAKARAAAKKKIIRKDMIQAKDSRSDNRQGQTSA